MIHTMFNKPEHVYTPSGSIYLDEYQEGINEETGSLYLEKIGKKNIYEMIQEDADSVDIEHILHSVAMGDLNALKAREGMYVDATTMPKSLREAQDLVIRLKDEFYKLPIEVRKEFGNDPEAYVSEMGTQEYLDKMAPYNEKILAISKEKNAKEYERKVKEGAKLNLDIEREMEAMKGGSEQ